MSSRTKHHPYTTAIIVIDRIHIALIISMYQYSSSSSSAAMKSSSFQPTITNFGCKYTSNFTLLFRTFTLIFRNITLIFRKFTPQLPSSDTSADLLVISAIVAALSADG